ncbi:hypothetical protein I926_09565 [Pasteurella multocida subsp. multocida OH4807]|nr:hypothetical protein I926_09565 [Pasteurella multocida subsp. multocida OH4807]
MEELIHYIVNNNYFILIAGIASIISLFLTSAILYKINISVSNKNKISNKGDNNIISGRDSNVQR